MKSREMLAAARHRIVMWWSNFGIVRKALLIAWGAAITIIPMTNETMNLYDRFAKKTDQPVECEQVRTLSTNEVGFVSTKPFELAHPTNRIEKKSGDTASLRFIVKQMAASHQAGHYDEAINYARTAETLLANCAPLDTSSLSARIAIKSCLMEECFYNKRYDRVIELHKEMQSPGGNRYIATQPRFIALESVATLLKEGKSMFFFSPGELGRFKSWDKEMLEEYFGYLAAWGYVQPITIDPRIKSQVPFYYEDFFGFSKPLPYQPSYTLSAHLTNGVELTSNEMSARWAGRKKFVSVDIDKCVGDELCLKEDERDRRPLNMVLRINEEAPDKASIGFYPTKGLGISPDASLVIRRKGPWTPGLTSSLMKQQIVCVGKIHTQKVVEYKMPIQAWITIIFLVAMAFASPTQVPESDNTQKG